MLDDLVSCCAASHALTKRARRILIACLVLAFVPASGHADGVLVQTADVCAAGELSHNDRDKAIVSLGWTAVTDPSTLLTLGRTEAHLVGREEMALGPNSGLFEWVDQLGHVWAAQVRNGAYDVYEHRAPKSVLVVNRIEQADQFQCILMSGNAETTFETFRSKGVLAPIYEQAAEEHETQLGYAQRSLSFFLLRAEASEAGWTTGWIPSSGAVYHLGAVAVLPENIDPYLTLRWSVLMQRHEDNS